MTNEEAMVFMDNLIICIKEHPILADWLVEIANRKTEPDCKTCGHWWKSEDVCLLDDCHYEPETVPIKKTMTGSKGERIEYTEAEMVVRDEPQTDPCDDCERCLNGDYNRYEPAVSALLRYTCRKRKEPQTDCAWGKGEE